MAARRARGFSLLELIVVMSVTVLLTGLLLPALIGVRENAHRVICSSNLRQLGLAVVLYADDHDGNLPPSRYGMPGGDKKEMMIAHAGKWRDNWDGWGWLYRDFYVNAPEIFYCPSHHGKHFYERYERLWRNPGFPRIYTNYHYAGPMDWQTGAKRRLDKGRTIVVATDGMRTVRDINHTTGLNVLRGDTSVQWRDDVIREIFDIIPPEGMQVSNGDDIYSQIWQMLGELD